jgi:uncharacterized repeat protein (TIGR01451 family)/LPXTG-motif cell wall-anchored protein
MRRRPLPFAVVALLGAVAVVIPLSLPASANMTGGIAAVPTTIAAGDTSTVTATFTISPPVRSDHIVAVRLAPQGATTGSASLSLVSATGVDPAGCGVNGSGDVVCTSWPTAGNGATATITVTLATSLDALGTWRLTGTWSDNVTGGSVGFVDVSVTPPPPSADLAISKTDDSDLVLPGATLAYTLNYSNNGPDDATGVTTVDVLPDDVTLVSAPGCTAIGQTVTCDIGALASGASGQVVITATVDSAITPGSTLTNEAAISAAAPSDPDASNDSASATTTVPEIADISITKTDDADPVLPGATLTYTLGYVNNGPSSATAIQVIDDLPDDVTLVSASWDGGTCSGATTVTCDIGTLPSGSSGAVTIEVTVSDMPSTSPMSNSATISMDAAIHDPDSSNNSATEETTNQATVDMSIGKSDDVDPVVAGTQLVYTLGYQNLGVSDATGVQIVDTLPTGVTFVSASGASCSELSGVVTCDVGNVASADPPVEIAIVVDVDPSLTAGATLTNTATISANEVDQVPGSDTTEETTAVARSADLSVAKEDGADPVTAGGQIVYTVDYENAGPSDTRGVQIVDTLPAGVTFVSAAPDDGSCSESSGTITCDIGDLAIGDSGQITLIVDVSGDESPGTVSNTVTILSDSSDPNPDNDTALEDTTIAVAADLSVNKTATPDPVSPGDDVIYTIIYSNAGPSSAVDAVVVDTLPPGVVFQSATPDSGTCDELGGVVSCRVGAVGVGTDGSIVVIVTVPSIAASGPLTNQVEISSVTTDPTPGDNTAVAVVEVAAPDSTTTTTTPSTTTSTMTPATTTTSASGDLPLTGSNLRILAAIGTIFLLTGLLVLVRRRTAMD